jgi:beta-galactosidase beta subunit
MKWTLAWFSYQERKWQERSEDASNKELEGHKCYAEKQIFVWGMMKKHFQDDWAGITRKEIE